MSDYLSVSERERSEMLAFLGISDVAELYSDLPRALRKKKFALSDGMSQQETYEALASLAARTAVYKSVFRGAGRYNHYLPAAV